MATELMIEKEMDATLVVPLGVQLMDELFVNDSEHYRRIVRMDAEIESLPLNEEAVSAIVASVIQAA